MKAVNHQPQREITDLVPNGSVTLLMHVLLVYEIPAAPAQDVERTYQQATIRPSINCLRPLLPDKETSFYH
jgi:hypothetical protein